jgi:hypothetical protein
MVDWRKEMFERNPLYLDDDATSAMSFFMPLTETARVVVSDSLPPNLKRDIGLSVWSRAVVLDDDGNGVVIKKAD